MTTLTQDFPNFVAAWLTPDSVAMLRAAGITKVPHLTTFFAGPEQLKWLPPAPWRGVEQAQVVAVKEWPVNNRRFLIAELQCDWSHAINEHYRQAGGVESLPHLAHITLMKDVEPGAAAWFQQLVGQTLSFDRHGTEEACKDRVVGAPYTGIFEACAGDHPETDKYLREELALAGIAATVDIDNVPPGSVLRTILRKNSGEVKTCIRGHLHGWTFTREWSYWVAEGPGLDVDSAERLYASYGADVVIPHVGCDAAPRAAHHGFGVPCYHVFTIEGLRALANTLRSVAAKNQTLMHLRTKLADTVQ